MVRGIVTALLLTLGGCRQLLGFDDVAAGQAGDGSLIDQPGGDGPTDGPTDVPNKSFACPNDDAALLGCYTFDDDTTDRSNFHHDLNANGTTFAAGLDGRAISITAGANVTSAGTTDFNVNTYTIRMSINPSTLPAGANRFGLFDSNLRYRMFLHSGGVLRCAFTGAAASIEQFSPLNAIATNVWTQVACTYDGTTLRIFVNGVEVAAKAVTDTIAGSTEGIVVGQNSPIGENFEGLIDNLEVWSGIH